MGGVGPSPYIRHEIRMAITRAVSEIDNHATLRLAFDRDLDLIGVAMQSSTLGVPGQKMGTIHVFGHTNLHGVRITQTRKWELVGQLWLPHL